MFNFGDLSMKKSLIALAALAATSAFAQSSVTLYGRIDMGWGTATTKAANGTQDKSTGLVDGTQTSNAIAFRGTEDLGGGLTAGFNLEQGISPTQAGGWNTRTASSAHQVANGGAISAGTMRAGNVSLRGGFGLVEVGTLQWSAGYAVSSRWGPFAEGFGGEAHTIMPSRITGLSYTTPAFSNTTVTLQHGGAHGNRIDRESVADAADGLRKNKSARTGINIQHAAGPLYLGAAYERTAVEARANVNGLTAGAALGTGFASNAYGAPVANGAAVVARTETAWAVAATYDLGVAQIRGMAVERDNGAVSATKTSGNGLAITVPMGAAAFGLATNNQKAKTAGATTQDVSGHQVNVRYNLSKRTNVYIHHGTDKDKGSAVTTSTQAKRTRTVAGLVHTF